MANKITSPGVISEMEMKDTKHDETEDDPEFIGTQSAQNDKLAMQRMGKKQQLIVCPELRNDSTLSLLNSTTATFPISLNRVLRGDGNCGLGDRNISHQPRPDRWRPTQSHLFSLVEFYRVRSDLS